METWIAVVLIAVVVVIGLAVLALAGLRTAGSVKRLAVASGQTGARYADATGLLRARRAALRVAIAQRKVKGTNPQRPPVRFIQGETGEDFSG